MNTIIKDKFGRPLEYLRLAVTDRCNLRCFYCMPAEGIPYLPKKELLSYEEMERLVRVCVDLGVSKLRITGGEPLLRKDLIPFLRRVRKIPGLTQLNMTSNGVLLEKHLPELIDLGLDSVNLSLDTLDSERFFKITRRRDFDKVLNCLQALMKASMPTKINAVVMAGQNTEDIIPLAQLGKDHPIRVRFIEEMPFNGEGKRDGEFWNAPKILAHLKAHFPSLHPLENSPHATDRGYKITGFKGDIGIIAAFTRTFCNTCNRIRLTAQGQLKTCLYDEGVLNLRDLLRAGISDEVLKEKLCQAYYQRPKDGFEAEQKRKSLPNIQESMSTIGG